MQNLQLDPVLKDYVIENGIPIPTDRVFESCYYALMIPQGKYIYGQQGQGSLIYTLEGIKRTASVEQLFASYSRDAIERQVIKTGQAEAISVNNIEATRTGSSNQINVVPKAVQISDQLNFVPL